MSFSPGIFAYKTECETCGVKLTDNSRNGMCKQCARQFYSDRNYSSVLRIILRQGSIKANT